MTATAPRPTPDDARKYFGLEALRFLAALTVLVWHYQHFFFNPPIGDATTFATPRQPGFSWLFPAYEQGAFAVQVFWALSGFIFFFKYGAAIHARRVTFRTYIVHRFSRLYPLHLATLVLVLALQLVYTARPEHAGPFVYPYNDALHFALNLFMIPHWGFQQGFSFNAPVWSVSVEEFCYLAFFLLASGVAFTRRSLTFLLVAAWILLAGKVLSPDFAECLSLFLLGGALYHLHASIARRGPRVERAVGVLAALVVAVAGFCQFHTPPIGLDQPLLATTVKHFVFVPSLLLAFVCLGPGGGDARPRFRLSDALGRLTYSTYMVHFPIQLATVTLTDALGWKREVFYRPEPLAIFVAVTLAVGYASYRWLEAPAQRWLRRRLVARPRPPASDATTAV